MTVSRIVVKKGILLNFSRYMVFIFFLVFIWSTCFDTNSLYKGSYLFISFSFIYQYEIPFLLPVEFLKSDINTAFI